MKNPLPTIRLTDDQLPEIKDWKVGGEYEIVVTVKQIAKRQGNEWGDMPEGDAGDDKPDKTITATFQVLEVEVEVEDNDADDSDTDVVGNYETDYAKNRSKANK